MNGFPTPDEWASAEKGEIHFPICSTCHEPMDWLQVFQDGKRVQESPICRCCHEYEAKILSIDDEMVINKLHKLRRKLARMKGGK